MALDINGYNTTFKAFADFAQKRVDAKQSPTRNSSVRSSAAGFSPSLSRSRTMSTSGRAAWTSGR